MAQEADCVQRLKTFVAHPRGVHAVRLGPRSGQVLATGGEDGQVNLWRIGRAACLLSISAAKSAVKSLAFDAEEKVVAAGSRSGSVHLFALNAGGKLRCRLAGHRVETTAVRFHPLGNMVASGAVDTNVKLWDVRSKSCVRTLTGHEGAVGCLAFSPDGRWVVSGAEDKTVRLWDLQAGKTLHEFAAHRGPVTSVGFHPDEFWLATAAADGTVKYFDLETFRLVGSTPTERGTSVRNVSFLGAAAHEAERKLRHSLVSVTDEGVKVWRWQPCRCIASEPVDWGAVGDAAVSLDKNGDQRLVTCNFKESSMVSVWSVNLSQMLHPAQHPDADDDEDASGADDSGEAFSRLPRVAVAQSPPRGRKTEAKSTEDDETERVGAADQPTATCAVGAAPVASDSDANSVSDSYESEFEEEDLKGHGHGHGQGRLPAKPRTSEPRTSEPSPVPKQAARCKTGKPRESKDPESAANERDEDEDKGEDDNRPGRRHKAVAGLKRLGSPVPVAAASSGSEAKLKEEAAKKEEEGDGEGDRLGSAATPARRLVSLARRDSPLDLNISEFMPRNTSSTICSRTVRAELKTGVAEAVLRGHRALCSVLEERADELERLAGLWAAGEAAAAMEHLETLRNNSLTYDLLRLVNLRNGQTANLDVCAAVLPALSGLCESSFEEHVRMALGTAKFLLDGFGGLIASTLDSKRRAEQSGVRGAVDVSREERVAKCERCRAGFREIAGALKALADSPAVDGTSGRTRREAGTLVAKMEKQCLV